MNSRNESQRDVPAKTPVQFTARAGTPPAAGSAAAERIAYAIHNIVLNRSLRGGLVNQIVDQVTRYVESGTLKPMDKMPSVRNLARQMSVSAFTIVEAYDRLVSGGQLVSRRGTGYYIAQAWAEAVRPETRDSLDVIDCSGPYSQEYSPASSADIPVGCSWLPPEWHDQKWMQDCARTALRLGAALVQSSNHVLGNVDLRRQMARRMRQNAIEVDPEQLLLTRSAMHGIDLVLGVLVRRGDFVLVEDPTHPGLLPLLARHGCIPLPVTRSASGLDLESLAFLAERHRPKLGLITTVLHNPIGTTLPASQAHRLLALAEQFDFMLVEDDIFRDLAESGDASLSAMDGLKRVIRIDSTSKLMPSLARVGSIAAAAPLVAEMARLRLVTGSSGTEFVERVALHALSSGEFRRHLARVRTRLEQARGFALQLLPQLELTPLAIPDGGMFLCARPQNAAISIDRAMQVAKEHRVVLSPGSRFGTSGLNGRWFRLNVAYADHPAVSSVFTQLAQESVHTSDLFCAH